MSVFLDIIGSVIIGAYVLLMGIRLNSNISDHVQASIVTLNLQETLVDAVRTMESDFRKIGFGTLDPRSALEITGPDHIRFKSDLNRDGFIEHVDWGLKVTVDASGDTTMVLIRQVSGEAPMLILSDVMSFRLDYFTETGTPADTIAKGQIMEIQTAVKIRSPFKVADAIKGSEEMKEVEGFWRQTRLASRNLKRHG